MVLTVYTDGGSLNNPGQAAFAYVIYDNGKIIFKYAKEIGVATNNVAEYSGLIAALEKIKELKLQNNFPGLKTVLINSDSQLMVNQLNGLYKVKNAAIRELVLTVRILENEINLPIKYHHVIREKNQLADSLVKKALGR